MFCLYQVLIWEIQSHQTKIKVSLKMDLMSPYPVATPQQTVVQRYSGIASIPDQLLITEEPQRSEVDPRLMVKLNQEKTRPFGDLLCSSL